MQQPKRGGREGFVTPQGLRAEIEESEAFREDLHKAAIVLGSIIATLVAIDFAILGIALIGAM